MKLLFDQNISFRVLKLIEKLYPESKHVKDFNLQYSTDHQIWKFAKTNDFHLVKFDADFYDLFTLYGHPPKLLWLRMGNTFTQNIASTLIKHYDSINKFINDKALQDISSIEIY